MAKQYSAQSSVYLMNRKVSGGVVSGYSFEGSMVMMASVSGLVIKASTAFDAKDAMQVTVKMGEGCNSLFWKSRSFYPVLKSRRYFFAFWKDFFFINHRGIFVNERSEQPIR